MLCCAVVVDLQELQRAVQLSPDTGFEKYMYLGQLLEGEEALAATQNGVELLQQVSMAAGTQTIARHSTAQHIPDTLTLQRQRGIVDV
jgi:hypothetical protein